MQNSNLYSYLFQFKSKFHETSWFYCLLKVSTCALVFFFLIYTFFKLTFVMEKGGLLQNSNF